MRNLKKFLALVLAMMMAFSLMVSANAANAKTDYPDMDAVLDEFEEAVDVLSGMGVFRGNNGDFKPQDEIMRCEAVAILYRLVTGDVNDTQVDLYKPLAVRFNDVPQDAWFAGYVGFAVDAGLVNGYNGDFLPYKNVTGYEMLKMLLKAVGYGKNGEFTGALWQINVGSQAQSLGILSNINSTHYANTLSKNSPREVVADLTFQTAAYVPTVRYELGYYNPYVGVAVGTGGNVKNQTLGEREFGLTLRTGIVVGNQATGEDDTLLGASAKGIWTNGNLTGVELTQGGSYYYYTSDGDGTNNPDDATTATAPNGNVTVAFNFGTGLDLFGHKVNTWYDSRTAYGSQTFDAVAGITTPAGYSRTYAVIDKATLVKTVWADSTTDNAPVGGKTSVYSAAVAKGFANWYVGPAWESDRFSQMGANGDGAAVQSKVGMYRVISNNGNLTPDVVISLNQEVANITQRNTTVKGGEYIYIGTGSSQFGAVIATGSTGTPTATKGVLLDALLAPGSDETLGDLVTANEIVGTAVVPSWIVSGDTITDHKIATDSTASTIDPKYCHYETSKLEPAFTGTVSTYILSDPPTNTPGNHVVKVTLTSGDSYDLSGITGANLATADTSPATAYAWAFDTTTHLIDNALTTLFGNNTSAGTTYTFYEDEVGRFIGVTSPNPYEFMYVTFADYEIGALGTGTIGYHAYGVNWDGEIVNKQINAIIEPTKNDGATPPDPMKYDFEEPTTGVPSASGVTVTFPNGTDTLAQGYNALPVTLKDQGTSVVGNQIKEGNNTRFAYSPSGVFNWGANGGSFGTRFVGYASGATIQDTVGALTINSGTWNITASDARNGFKRVYGASMANATTGTQNAYLLTETTKFIVVTGSGTADLKVKIYTGLTELLDGGTSAEITYDYANGGDNIYFLTVADKFNNVNTTDNGTIDTVILSDSNLTQYTQQSLYFSEPGNSATGVKLAGGTNVPASWGTVNQYKLYNQGKADYYWVADGLSTGVSGANNANGTAGDGDFYRLTPVGTVNGQPVYKADIVTTTHANYDATATTTNADGCNVNWTYNYIVVNDLSTAEIGNIVFKVSGATVTQAFGDNTDGSTKDIDKIFPDGVNITDIQTLNNAVAMGKAGTSGSLYTVKVAIVYDGLTVPTIYVTNITTQL